MEVGIEVINESAEKLIEINGNYFPYNTNDRLNLVANFKKANLNVIEPFYENLIKTKAFQADNHLCSAWTV